MIASELMRNLNLAVAYVFAITLILLSDFSAAFLVLVFVLFSLVDVIGFLHFWGMTIEVLSCSNIVMSVGLCVDYSANIAHAFLVSSGKAIHFKYSRSKNNVYILFRKKNIEIIRVLLFLINKNICIFN